MVSTLVYCKSTFIIKYYKFNHICSNINIFNCFSHYFSINYQFCTCQIAFSFNTAFLGFWYTFNTLYEIIYSFTTFTHISCSLLQSFIDGISFIFATSQFCNFFNIPHMGYGMAFFPI